MFTFKPLGNYINFPFCFLLYPLITENYIFLLLLQLDIYSLALSQICRVTLEAVFALIC